MATAFTFGSLGDILSVCQISLQLCQALGKRGSAKEYQDFRRDIEAYGEMLMQVVTTAQERGDSPALAELDRITKKSVDECATSLRDELMRQHDKFNESLQPGGSGCTLKDMMRKTQFAFKERESIHSLREKLDRDTQRIDVLLKLAAEKSARVDNATLSSRLGELDRIIEELSDRFTDQVEISRKHQLYETEMMEEHNMQLALLGDRMAAQEVNYWKILGQTEGTTTVLREIKKSVQLISAQQQYRSSDSMFFSAPDPTLGKPVYFEDSLGNMDLFSVELIRDWNFFDILLKHRFEHQKGYKMVVRGDYALEDGASGRDIDRTLPWHACIRRGMKLNMSMVFIEFKSVSSSCPRCKATVDARENVNIQCPNDKCRMWFKMSKRTKQNTRPSPHVVSVAQLNIEDAKETMSEENINLEPSDFQRVRLVTSAADSLTDRLHIYDFKCTTCGHGYPSRSDFWSHIQGVHKRMRSAECPRGCGRIFVCMGDKERHSKRCRGLV